MNENSIKGIFKDRMVNFIGQYRKNAVMILLYNNGKEDFIIFEKRALTMRKQPGDICLPGGKVEEGELPFQAAIRETCEELMIKEENIDYIGEMDYLITPYGNILYPFVAYTNILPEEYNASEVHEIIKVPLNYLLEVEPIRYDMKIGPTNLEGFPFNLINGGEDYKFSSGTIQQYFYKYEDIVIWGFTARIVKEFLDIVKNKEINYTNS